MTTARWVKRPAMALGVLTALAIALTGCSGTSSNAAGSTTTLKMIFEPGPEADAMAKLVKTYNAGPGKKDHIAVQITQLSRTDTFAKEATVMATKSSEYDIYRTTSYLIAQHAPYLDPITVNQSAYFPTAVDSLKVGGKLYGLPLDVSNQFLFYRKDLIDAMMKDPSGYAAISKQVVGQSLQPKDPSAWNWDDYIASAAYFTKKYNPSSPMTYGTILQAKNLVYNSMVWDDVLWSFGGNWLTKSGQPDLTSSAAKKAVAVYSTAYTKGVASPDSSQAEFPETEAAMTSGNAAFAIQWGAGFAELNDPSQSPTTAGKIGIAPIPGPTHKTHVHALSIGINKYGKNKADAAKFIAYLATANTMTAYVKAGGIAAMPQVLTDNASVNPLFPYLASDISKYGFSEPPLPRAFDVYTAIADKLSAAWVGQGSPDAALSSANQALAGLISK